MKTLKRLYPCHYCGLHETTLVGVHEIDLINESLYAPVDRHLCPTCARTYADPPWGFEVTGGAR